MLNSWKNRKRSIVKYYLRQHEGRVSAKKAGTGVRKQKIWKIQGSGKSKGEK